MGMLWLQAIQVLAFVALLAMGFSIGGFAERRHFKSLARREAALGDLLVNDLSSIPVGCATEPYTLVMGHVVIATDYFKTFAAKIKKIFGGELRSFDSMMERARREALLRMMESARDLGANRVINVRFATSSIGGARKRQRAAMVEMIAYGTALRTDDQVTGQLSTS